MLTLPHKQSFEEKTWISVTCRKIVPVRQLIRAAPKKLPSEKNKVRQKSTAFTYDLHLQSRHRINLNL